MPYPSDEQKCFYVFKPEHLTDALECFNCAVDIFRGNYIAHHDGQPDYSIYSEDCLTDVSPDFYMKDGEIYVSAVVDVFTFRDDFTDPNGIFWEDGQNISAVIDDKGTRYDNPKLKLKK